MRVIGSGFFAFLLLLVATLAARADQPKRLQFSSPERVSQWISHYHDYPDPAQVPQAVHAMRQLGLFKDQKKAGFFIGFIAGVLGANQLKAQELVSEMFPMPPKDQAILIRAIAYSGLPEWQWKQLLNEFSERMPLRRRLIDKFLLGEEKVLWEKPLSQDADVLDTLWGYYAATGYRQPVERVIYTLRWSKRKDEVTGFSFSKIISKYSFYDKGPSVDQLMIGSLAKWTLASNAERDRDLLDLYRTEVKYQPKAVAAALRDIISAAEEFEAERIRDDAKAALVAAKERAASPYSRMSNAAYAGSVAISTACVVANVLGHPEIGAPCIVTGALYSGAANLLTRAVAQ